ncbi:hypothetical protein [Pedobacter aquatilis]|uniref:hypothetical protein n=1 Tax=Pedobacter aquatilis TaxID=351343 RepID=UPI00292F46A4|nr:hypothetical protein [Pedobacter aquatilis]
MPCNIQSTTNFIICEEESFSLEFKSLCNGLMLITTSQLLALNGRQILNLEGFNHRMLYEYVNFMTDRGMGKYVRP